MLIGVSGVVLLKMFPPEHTGALHPALRTRAMLSDLQLAIKNYGIEYNAWPDSRRPDTQFEVVRGSLLRNLLGEKTNANRREIKFVEFAKAGEGVAGLRIENDGEPRLVDEWGHDVFVGFDTGNGILAWPQGMKNPPRTVPDSVALFSCGRDGIPGTEDDIKNWKP